MPDTYRINMNDSTSISPPPAADVANTIGLGRVKTKIPKIEKKWLIGGAVALVVLIVVIRSMGGPAAPKFISADVMQGGLTVTVTATGQLQPRNQVDVGAEISGQSDGHRQSQSESAASTCVTCICPRQT